MSELLPCPFCGSEVIITGENYHYDGGDLYSYYSADVMCYRCDLLMHVCNPASRIESQPEEKALNFVYEAWNKRFYQHKEIIHFHERLEIFQRGYEQALKEIEEHISVVKQQSFKNTCGKER